MKFKNIIRILSGSRSCETIIFSGFFLLLNSFMTFNYSYFITSFSSIFCESIFLDFILITCSVRCVCNRCACLVLMIIIRQIIWPPCVGQTLLLFICVRESL